MKQFVTQLHNNFSLKDLGPLKFFLSVEVLCTIVRLHLNQSKYANELLFKVGLQSYKSFSLLTKSGLVLSKVYNVPFLDLTLYHILVGVLQYCVIPHLDIMFVMSKFFQIP